MTDVESAAAIVKGLLGFLLLVVVPWWLHLARCFAFIRQLHSGTARGSRTEAAITLGYLTLMDVRDNLFDRKALFRRLRILSEHELFHPKPHFTWPPAETGSTGPHGRDVPPRLTVGQIREARRAARTEFRQELWDWRGKMRRALDRKGNATIHVDNPAIVNDAMEQVERYFQCLHGIGEDGGDAERFLCPIEIGSGFIAPLHLLSGLLVSFNEKWKDILDSFDRDANDHRGLPLDSRWIDFRQIQMFIYNCWLLWGPSIPVCKCRAWKAQFSVVQFGYGDENNSIEVAGESGEIEKALADLVAGEVERDRAERSNGENDPPERPFAAMAIPANVLGRLRLSGSIARHDSRDVNALPQAARTSWGGGQDARPILFISEIVGSNVVENDASNLVEKRGRIRLDQKAQPSRYYSAYLWVAFAVVIRRGDELVPLGALRGGHEPWKDFIPFFEHGNLADPETCAFGKQQLARKVVTALDGLLQQLGEPRVAIEFAFASAIDEPGCGYGPAFPDWVGGPKLRELIKRELERHCASGVERSALRKAIHFDHFTGRMHDHPFAACQLPEHVRDHYAYMRAHGA